MRFFIFTAACAVAVSVVGCSNNHANPGAPTTSTGTTGAAALTILGERGAQSFTPNPASVSQGQMITWHNTDDETHHIVLNDGSLDTGDIKSGATSDPLPLPTNGANYHCTIHPTMVGSIAASSGAPPPCTGYYCG